jgi:hypothetical protein
LAQKDDKEPTITEPKKEIPPLQSKIVEEIKQKISDLFIERKGTKTLSYFKSDNPNIFRRKVVENEKGKYSVESLLFKVYMKTVKDEFAEAID